jgi:hypothetical protein
VQRSTISRYCCALDNGEIEAVVDSFRVDAILKSPVIDISGRDDNIAGGDVDAYVDLREAAFHTAEIWQFGAKRWQSLQPDRAQHGRRAAPVRRRR